MRIRHTLVLAALGALPLLTPLWLLGTGACAGFLPASRGGLPACPGPAAAPPGRMPLEASALLLLAAGPACRRPALPLACPPGPRTPVQVWDHLTGRLKMDLPYQAQEQFMLHDSAVLALAFSRDSELLATGDQDGRIKVGVVQL